MRQTLRSRSGAAVAASGLDRDLAAQVAFLADQPTESLLWSDAIDAVGHAIEQVRRMLAGRLAQAAR